MPESNDIAMKEYKQITYALYVEMAKRGWNAPDLSQPLIFPWDRFTAANPEAQQFVYDLEKKMGGYVMSERQCSAVVMVMALERGWTGVPHA